MASTVSAQASRVLNILTNYTGEVGKIARLAVGSIQRISPKAATLLHQRAVSHNLDVEKIKDVVKRVSDPSTPALGSQSDPNGTRILGGASTKTRILAKLRSS